VESLIGNIIGGVVMGIFAGGAMIATVRVEMKFLRRDVDHAHRRIDDMQKVQA
jgi:hypothetical protein